MRKTNSVCLLLPLLLLFAVGCVEDKPVVSGQPQQVVLADTSAHLVADILTFYGGPGFDWGTTVIELPNGGWALAGSTDSYGAGKNTLYVVRADADGQMMWENIFGGDGEDNAEAMALTADGNLIIAGETSSLSGSYDFYLLKVSLNGSLMWEKSFGSGGLDWGTDIVVLDDGYAVCGYTEAADRSDRGNFMLVRTDLNGDEIWTKIFSLPDREWAYAMTGTSDGGFVLAGRSHNIGLQDVDILLIKADDTGGVVWERAYGGDGDEMAFAVIECRGGGYVVAGSSRSFSADNYQWNYVMKVDVDGNMVWEQCFGEALNFHVRDIVENPDGTFLLTGITNADGPGTDVAKLSASGDVLWNETIGLNAAAMSIVRNSRGMFAITGFAFDTLVVNPPDMLLMRVSER